MSNPPARAPKPKPIGPVTEDVHDARAEWDAKVAEMTERAEAELHGDVVPVPDAIYSGLQEAGVYSADPVIDADPELPNKFPVLWPLVKEFSVSPSGKWEVTLTDREIAAVERGEWCVNCGAKQVFDDAEWERRMSRLEERIGPRPDGVDRKCGCPICGAKLGIQEIVQPEPILGPQSFTPEQQALVEEFFAGNYELQRDDDVDADTEQADADSE